MRGFALGLVLLIGCAETSTGADVVDGKADDSATSGRGSTATVTCDFGFEPGSPQWNLGALSFRIKLGTKSVATTCVAGKECMLDGNSQTFSLVGLTRWDTTKAARFSKNNNDNNVAKIFLTGSTGDDLEPSVFITYMGTEDTLADGSDLDAYAVLIVNDGQYINGLSKAVGCTSTVQ